MNIVIIGGNGAFGSRTIARLLRDRLVSSVISMDVAPPREWLQKLAREYGEKFQYVRADICQLEDIVSVIRTYRVDRLINFAYLMGAALEANPRLATKVNILGMSNSFEAARLMGVSRVVYASSETVYGTQADHGDKAVTEDDRWYPNNAYSLSKCYAEVLAEQYSRLFGLNLTALRPAIGYGFGGRVPDSVKWFSDIVSLPAVGKPVSLETDGRGRYSVVYYDDVGEFASLLIQANATKFSAYNIGRHATTLRDLAQEVLHYIPDARIEFGTKAGDSSIVWDLDMSRAKQEFGFSLKPLGKAVLLHINEARAEAGLPLLKK